MVTVVTVTTNNNEFLLCMYNKNNEFNEFHELYFKQQRITLITRISMRSFDCSFRHFIRKYISEFYISPINFLLSN